MSDGFFTAIERQSAAATKVREHLDARLTSLRSQNDSATLTPKKTAKLRGRIAEVKAMQSLFEPGNVFSNENELFKD